MSKRYTLDDVLKIAELHEANQENDEFFEQFATYENQMKIAQGLFDWHLANATGADQSLTFLAASEGSVGYTAGFFAGVHAEREAQSK